MCWKSDWKFSAGQVEPGFGALSECGDNENERTFFVQDNGVGFDPRQAANLLDVFQRLPAAGLDLARVRDVGRSRAAADVDQGTTTYFTIAKGRQ